MITIMPRLAISTPAGGTSNVTAQPHLTTIASANWAGAWRGVESPRSEDRRILSPHNNFGIASVRAVICKRTIPLYPYCTPPAYLRGMGLYPSVPSDQSNCPAPALANATSSSARFTAAAMSFSDSAQH